MILEKIIINIIKTAIIILIFATGIYMIFGVYKENKIRLANESLESNFVVEHVSKSEEKTNNIVSIPSNYLGYEVAAKLIIPDIDLETYVLKDYLEEGMKVCVSKYWGPSANEIGNFCIAGHNYEMENMFNHLIDLEIGDELFLLDNTNGEVRYVIYDIYKVTPDNTEPLSQDTDGNRIVTLITCVNYSKNRLIVKAVETI